MKRVTELRGLSEDHHSALVLARRCKRAGSTNSKVGIEQVWEHVLEAFSSHLEPHFEIEERYLLPALEEIGEDALADRIRSDHEALRNLLKREGPDPELLMEFGELLEIHARFEEQQVFEGTQHRLEKAALEGIAQACESTPRIVPQQRKKESIRSPLE